MKKMRIATLLVLGLLLLSACNLSASEDEAGDQVLTAAVETANAQLTQTAAAMPPTNTPEPTGTPTSTQTSTPEVASTATSTKAPVVQPQQPAASSCDAALFVSDVTIPDGTQFAPSATFTKTWRLKNNGTCTWDSNYELVFASGDTMSGPASKKLTTGTVAPGGTVDISVDLTAPTASGTFRGYWQLRNGSGGTFGVPGPFYVEIKVTGGTPASGTVTVTATGSAATGTTTVTLTVSNAGTVLGDGSVELGQPKVGDRETNVGSQGFVTFDISGIPSSATIKKVTVNFSSFDINSGDPFGNLGCLRAYSGSFFPLQSSDYAAPGAGGSVLIWCDANELASSFEDADVKTELQSVLGNSTYELRLQFKDMETNADGIKDLVRLGNLKLVVEYSN